MEDATSNESEPEERKKRRRIRRRHQNDDASTEIPVIRAPQDSWRIERARPLNVLLLGRTGTHEGGGIARSASMISSALKAVGNRVRVRNVRTLLTDIPSDTDLVWHYGDWDHVEQQIAAATEEGLPVLVNSTYDDSTDRRRWVIENIERWRKVGRVYMAVFSLAAQRDPRMQKVWDRLVVVPKTVRGAPTKKQAPFEERSGVCIGEVEKLARARLVRGMDVKQVVNAIQSTLPGMPIYAFDQYATKGTVVPEGVTVIKPGDRMMSFLGTLLFYVSLMRHETFSMVPVEAQAMGTPVLYRPMPQSLSEHIGLTGYPYETVQELVTGMVKLTDPECWRTMSYAGSLNAASKSVVLVGPALDMALRKVVFAS